MPPRIAIIGAGMAGLTLARILHLNGMDPIVFERESSRSARSQGGSLDLHPQTGQAALEMAGLRDKFLEFARYDGQDLVIADKHDNRVVQFIGQDLGRPEIDRRKLREILLDSLPATIIEWGKSFVGVDPETRELEFLDGTKQTGFDLIVGADGAFSRVRKLLTFVSPFYSGVSLVEFSITDADIKSPAVAELAGKGSYYAYSDEEGHCLLVQRQGNGSIRGYAVGRRPENWTKSINWNDGNQVKAILSETYSSWSPGLQDVVKQSDELYIPRPVYMLPVGLRWPTQRGITLLGDSAHLMTFFAGEGVNLAMQDALELSKLILDHPEDVGGVVEEYENGMYARSKPIAELTWEMTQRRFEKGGTEAYKEVWVSQGAFRKEGKD